MRGVIGGAAIVVALAGCSSTPAAREAPMPDTPPSQGVAPSIGIDVPDDAEVRMTAVLTSTTPATLDRDVASAFADAGLVTSTEVSDDLWVAAVGRVGGGDCLVAVRDAQGVVSFPSFPKEWLMPGELGCSTALVTSPPL